MALGDGIGFVWEPSAASTRWQGTTIGAGVRAIALATIRAAGVFLTATMPSLWGAFIRSGMVLGGDAVLVDESAEPVVSADRAGGRRRDRLCWLAGLGRSGAERAVRPMPVVVVDELVQDMP